MKRGRDPRSRDFPHHHDFRRADDAGCGDFLYWRAAAARLLAHARAQLSHQEMGRRGGDARDDLLRHRHRLALRRADADPRAPKAAQSGAQCDASGCAAQLLDGRLVALLRTREALVEDCRRAALVIAPFPVPSGCGAATIIDRRHLDTTGAVTLKILGEQFEMRSARAIGENRPWSRAPADIRSARLGSGTGKESTRILKMLPARSIIWIVAIAPGRFKKILSGIVRHAAHSVDVAAGLRIT